MSALQAAAAIERGTLTCEALAHACLERIDAREPVVHAWREIDVERTLACARALDRQPRQGPLHGLPVAVKDIIATGDWPTRHGSPIYANAVPVTDAACVSLLRERGGVIPGKTVTTEFAFSHPGPTANPRNPLHTPGGSSSGSAAAVADSMVPLGLGTQTAGSVIRPAAFCGIVGFKPTFGRLNVTGIKPFATSLDTLGCFARDVADIELLRSMLTDGAYRPLEAPAVPLRIGMYRSSDWAHAQASSQKAVLDVADALRRDADVRDVDPLPEAKAVTEAQRVIMAFESAQSLRYEYRAHRAALSARLIEWLEIGMNISYAEYVGAQHDAAKARGVLRSVLANYDVLITPSAPGEAPVGLDATGDPVFNRLWTMLGVPAVSIPVASGPSGLPIAVQLIGAWDRDRDLLAIAHSIEQRVRAGSSPSAS